MKKFLLYFLLLLLILGIGALAFGFWNARKIQDFSKNAQSITEKYKFDSQIGEIEKNIRGSGGKKPSEINQDAKSIIAQLDGIIGQSQAAEREVRSLWAPKEAGEARSQLISYYGEVGRQASDLRGFMQFMSENFEVAEVFSQIGENTTLDDMKNLIAQAKSRVSAIIIDSLPDRLRPSASGLVQSMQSFLQKLEETAMLASQDVNQLNTSYSEFSKKQSEFTAEGKKYIGEMEDLSLREIRIRNELLKLNGIYFKIR